MVEWGPDHPDWRPPRAPLVPFVKGVSHSAETKKKQLTTKRRHAIAVEKAKVEGFNEAMEKFTPGVIENYETSARIVRQMLLKVEAAVLADDLDTVKALQSSIAMFKKESERQMDRRHGTPIARTQSENLNTNVSVEVHLDDVVTKFPFNIGGAHEVIDGD